MEKIHVRKLAFLTKDEILSNGTKYLVMFDDGVEFPMHPSHIVLSWPYWGITRHYSQVPITSELAYNYHSEISDSKHMEMCSKAIELTRKFPDIDKRDVWEIAYRFIYNEAYNLAVEEFPRYANTIDFDDIEELLNDPDIKREMDNIEYTADSVAIVHSVVNKVINSDRYPLNGMVVEANVKTAPMAQIYQAFSRGRQTEVNSMIFDRPIPGGFFTGFDNVAEFAKEMTSATKSYVYNDGYIAASEYFNRKMQLMTTSLTHLVPGDCGTVDVLRLPVPRGDIGKVFIKRCEGIYRKVGGDWVLMKGDEFDLLGKVILLRTTLSCTHLKDQGVCEMCYGDLSYNIAECDSPGHVSCISITEGASQKILSVKHLDFIDWIFKVIMAPEQQHYFTTSPNPAESNRVYVKSDLNTTDFDIRIRVSKDEVQNIGRLEYITAKRIKTLDIGDISQITKYWVDVYGLNDEGNEDCALSSEFNAVCQGVPMSFSIEFLRFIKRNPSLIMVEDNDRYVSFSIRDFNVRNGKKISPCIFEYQQRHESIPVYVTNLENILRSDKRTQYKQIIEYDGSTSEGCAEALLAIHTYLERKLPGTPITHIATILAILRRQSRNDASIPYGFNNPNVYFDKHDNLMEDRSLGPEWLYENQNRMYSKPKTFNNHKRLNSLLDSSIFIPIEDKSSISRLVDDNKDELM